MKKIFSKFEKNEKLEGASVTKESSNYVGKSFTVGRVTVTVEDVLAEGKCPQTGRFRSLASLAPGNAPCRGYLNWICSKPLIF